MADKLLKSIKFPTLPDRYVIGDSTLTEEGAAADAKATGDEITNVKSAISDTNDLITEHVNGSGSSLIKLEKTVKGKLSFTLSDNEGSAKVVACGTNLADASALELKRSWDGGIDGTRSRLRIKTKPNTKITIKYNGINSGWEVAVFELKTYEANTAFTSHVMTYDTAITFTTRSATQWLSFLINKRATMSESDVENLVVYCNEGDTIIEEAYSGDSVETSASGTLATNLGLTYLYTTDDAASITYLYKTYINFVPYLIVCGADANDLQKSIAMNAMAKGYGYVCSAGELDTNVNAFIDKFMDIPLTIYFYGTIRTAEGIHKHPKHNLVGYDCILKMGDNLGTDYVSCIFPTSGGVSFSSKQVISHDNTFVKGFTFDGNCENNKENGAYKHNSIYGGTICGEIYNETEYPYSQTQLCSDIVLEDIKAVETMRGIIVGIGWKCRNLYIERAVTDHALYLAGADGAIVDNCYCTKTNKNGAIAISGQTWDVNRQVKNVRLKNVVLDECNGLEGPLLDIRGHFSAWGNDKTIDDVFIDGLFIKKRNNFQENPCIKIGTYSTSEQGQYTLSDHPLNVVIRNLTADIKLYNSLFSIFNARVKLENTFVRLLSYRYDRGLFVLQSKDYLKKVFDFSGLTVINEATESENPWTIFTIDNKYETHKYIHGLIFDDLYIEGMSNYYLFHVSDTSNTTYVRINDVSSERIVATPLGTINPARDRILFVADDYYQLET